MADFHEQRACIKFCFKLEKTITECYEMLKTAFGEQAMGRSVGIVRSQTKAMEFFFFTSHKILTEDLKMRRVSSKFVPDYS